MNPAIRLAVRADYDGRWASQVINDAKSVSQSVQSSGANVARSMTSASFATSNLAAQFNDIGVMLAAGQSPLLLAVQQGTQISQVLGPMKAGAAVKALGSAFMAMLSPLNVLTIGTIALGAAGASWLMSLNQEAPSAEEALKSHAEWLRTILEGYGDAQEAANAYIAEARKLPASVVQSDLSNSLLADQSAIAAQIEKAKQQQGELNWLIQNWTELRRESAKSFPDDLGRLARFDTLIEQASQLRDLTINASSTSDQLGQVMGALREMMATAQEPAIKGLATDMFQLAEILRMTKVQAAGTAAALSSVAGVDVGKGYRSAIGSLQGLGQPPLTDRDRAMQARNAGLSGAVDDITRKAVLLEYEQSLGRIAKQEAEREANRKKNLPTSRAISSAYLEETAALAAMREEHKRVNDVLGGMQMATQSFLSDLRRGLGEGKSLWQSFADAALSALTMISDRMLNSAISNFFGSMMVGQWNIPGHHVAGGFYPGLPSGGGGGLLGGSIIPGILHNGGIAGSSGLGHGRSVPASVFAGAPRFHGGTPFVMGPDEVPAILQRGERVIPRNGSAGSDSRTEIVVLLDKSLVGQILSAAREQSVQIVRAEAPAVVARAQRNGTMRG